MKLVKENLLIKIIFSALVIPALLLAVSLTFARREARVYLQPIDAIDRTLTVDVIVENVTDLYGAEFRLKYDPAVVSVQDLNAEQGGIQIEIGSLLSADQVFVVANEVDETEGIITFGVSLLNPAPPINDSGPLARVIFNVLQNSPATIDLEHAKLVNFDLQTIPSGTTSLAVSGTGSTGSETTSLTVGDGVAGQRMPGQSRPYRTRPIADASANDSDFPWWRIVAVMVIVAGMLMLGGILVLGSSGLIILTAVGKNKPHPRRRVPAGIQVAVYWSELTRYRKIR